MLAVALCKHLADIEQASSSLKLYECLPKHDACLKCMFFFFTAWSVHVKLVLCWKAWRFSFVCPVYKSTAWFTHLRILLVFIITYMMELYLLSLCLPQQWMTWENTALVLSPLGCWKFMVRIRPSWQRHRSDTEDQTSQGSCLLSYVQTLRKPFKGSAYDMMWNINLTLLLPKELLMGA